MKKAEALLTLGTLSNVESSRPLLEKNFELLVGTSAAVLENLVKAVNWSKEHSVAAQVDKILDPDEGTRSEDGNKNQSKDQIDDVQIPEPEMLCFCLHGLMDFLTTCTAKIQEVLASALAVTVQDAQHLATATQLVEMLLRILRTEAVHKDSLTSAAIVLCSLVAQTHSDEQAVALQLASLATCIEEADAVGSAPLWARSAPLFAAGSLPGRFALDPRALPPFAQQALVRAVLCSGPRRVATAGLPPAGADGDGEGGRSLLFMRAYARVCAACEDTADLFLVCYALQTLASALDAAVAAIRDALAAGAPAPATARVVERMYERGVGAVWPHCEDPFQGIADQTKDAFPRLVLLSELAQVPPAPRAAPERTASASCAARFGPATGPARCANRWSSAPIQSAARFTDSVRRATAERTAAARHAAREAPCPRLRALGKGGG